MQSQRTTSQPNRTKHLPNNVYTIVDSVGFTENERDWQSNFQQNVAAIKVFYQLVGEKSAY